jgi:hypothetical protein
MAEAALTLLRTHGNRLSAEAYDLLHSFIIACLSRLPSQAAVERDAQRRRNARHKPSTRSQ